jgi:predicted deacylase
MITYPLTLEESQQRLIQLLNDMKIDYHLEPYSVITNLQIYKIVIHAQEKILSRMVLSSGLHGIEGYVGHLMLEAFIKEELPKLKTTEVIIYHPINPFGMAYYRRVNEDNVDLNRNFSINHFSSTNEDYRKAKHFFMIKKYHSPFLANLRFLANILGVLLKTGVKSFKRATLLGQHELEKGIYYQSDHYVKSTEYMINEINYLYDGVDNVLWIDIHTGYGPRDEMSIVNSTKELMNSEDCQKQFDYPRITTLDQDDFYAIDGDMIEYLYEKKPEGKNLYATCFEFGTKKEGLWQQIQSLKAMMFENASYHEPMSRRFKIYAKDLMLSQFRPKDEAWIAKALLDFRLAYQGIIRSKSVK